MGRKAYVTLNRYFREPIHLVKCGYMSVDLTDKQLKTLLSKAQLERVERIAGESEEFSLISMPVKVILTDPKIKKLVFYGKAGALK